MGSTSVVIVTNTKPASHNNSELKRAWQDEFRRRATRKVSGKLPGKHLYAKVVYFHKRPSSFDVDNMSKPVIDALKGLAYADDAQVQTRLAIRINTKVDNYELQFQPTHLQQYNKLLEMISLKRFEDILFVEIGELIGLNLNVGQPLLGRYVL